MNLTQFPCVTLITIILINLPSFSSPITQFLPPDPDETLTFSQLISSRGFHLLSYTVHTIDGYILSLHRVVTPDYLTNPSAYTGHRKPVLLMHGLFTDSSSFFINSPFLHSNTSDCGDNFGFCLLLTGRYDVWAGNSRGNGQSDGHLWLSSWDPAYWAFSWDHMARYDLPAFFKTILSQTGHRSLSYVGISQGCTQLFALLSLRPEFASLIDIFIAWAPAVFFGRATSLIGVPLRTFHPLLLFPRRTVIGSPPINAFMQWYTCRGRSTGGALCNLSLESLFGLSNVNRTRYPVYGNFGPSPASSWHVAHYGQTGASGRFQRFNYGNTKANRAAYGQTVPPDYPLRNIPRDLKIVLFYGATDAVIVPEDVRMLLDILRGNRNDVTEKRVRSGIWSHADFVLGQKAGKLVYDDTVRYLDAFSGRKDGRI